MEGLQSLAMLARRDAMAAVDGETRSGYVAQALRERLTANRGGPASASWKNTRAIDGVPAEEETDDRDDAAPRQ
jgi:hypothetical protein